MQRELVDDYRAGECNIGLAEIARRRWTGHFGAAATIALGLSEERTGIDVTTELVPGEVIEIPIKHGEGQYVATPEQLQRIEDDGLVVFRYADAGGEVRDDVNPNGSLDNIAGVRNEVGNVVGLMPHPEHAVDPDVGPTGGQPLFASLLASALAGASA